MHAVGNILRYHVIFHIVGMIWMPAVAASMDKGVEVDYQAAAVNWSNVSKIAIDLVRQETPATVFPFALPTPLAMASSSRKVFIYYFPFFLISMDNLPIGQDHWAAHYMKRGGEDGKYADAGGFTRERPLPVGPWDSPFWREIDEAVDVARARATGADGFGVGLQEVGRGPTFDIALGVCNAAAHVDHAFHVFPEPDGAVLRDVPASQIAEAIKTYDQCPGSLRLSDGHALVAPFGPQNEPVEYWRSVLDHLAAAGIISDFVPVLLDPGRFAEAFGPISTGMSFWGFRDSEMMHSVAGRQLVAKVRKAAPLWMQPVTPQDFRPKDTMFWEARNTEAFRAGWMKAIQDGAQYVHLITWNDYSEGTEIAPSSGTQFLFYDLTTYYTAWFKTGRPPQIVRDAIYYSHRNQIFQPEHPPLASDKPFRRFGVTAVANEIEMLAMLVQPATLEIDIAGHVYLEQAPAGLVPFRVPSFVGWPRFKIIRDGKVIVEKLSDWQIEEHPTAISPLYFGGSSTRAFVDVPAAH